MSEFLTPNHLKEFMRSHQIDGEICYLSTPTPTVIAAAQAVGTDPSKIIKSVLFMVKKAPVLAISCGTQRIERKAIASFFGVGRKQVKLADAESVLHITGYRVGTVPPFGHAHKIHTLVDSKVLEQDRIYAGGGAENALAHISTSDILRITGADIIDLHNQPLAKA